MRRQYNLEQFCDILVHSSVSIFFDMDMVLHLYLCINVGSIFLKRRTCMVHLIIFILYRYPMWRIPASTSWTNSYHLFNAIATVVHPVMSRLCTSIYLVIVCNSLPDNEYYLQRPTSLAELDTVTPLMVSVTLLQHLLLARSNVAGRVGHSDTTNGERRLVAATTIRRWQRWTQRHH
jgi:hypothetical protein